MATTQTYGLANNGAVPKTSGVLSGLTVKPYNPQQQQSQITNPFTGGGQSSTIPQVNKPVSQGTTSGQPLAITQPKPDTTYTHTTTTNNNGGTSTKATPNPSVLAQQKAMNKLGAGLVEDGLAGPKTSAAIASGKYNGTTGTTGTTSGVIPPPVTPVEPPKPTTPQVGTTMENAQNVLNAGQMSPQEQAANAEVAKANALQKSYQNVGTLSPYAEAGMYADRARTPEEIQALEQAPDLAGRAAGTSGLLNNLSNIYGSSRVAGANAALQGTQTAAQRGLSAAGTVLGAGLPQAYPYSSQIINPLTGQPVSGGTSGSLQDAVSNVVQKLNSGQMTYNDALNALSGYGQGGVNELQKQLPPGFNIAQSNTLSGQQGTVKINYELADKALSNVETLMKDLPALQNTNIPGVNALTQGFSTVTGLGSEQTRAVTGAVQSLRNAYASLLASARGGTPTDYSGQAQAEIPDKPTPNDIAAIRKNFETLGKVRTDILGNPGTSGGTSGSTTGGSIWNF